MGSSQDEYWMHQALLQAQKAYDLGEVPIGAVIVQDGEQIASAYNLREANKNALAHAEVLAIDQACQVLGGWRLPRCTLYVTLEPCAMCAGAMINARIDRVVYGAYDPKAGSCGTLTDLFALPYNHKPEYTGGVLEQECSALLRQFFQQLRKRSVEKTSATDTTIII